MPTWAVCVELHSLTQELRSPNQPVEETPANFYALVLPAAPSSAFRPCSTSRSLRSRRGTCGGPPGQSCPEGNKETPFDGLGIKRDHCTNKCKETLLVTWNKQNPCTCRRTKDLLNLNKAHPCGHNRISVSCDDKSSSSFHNVCFCLASPGFLIAAPD